MNIPTLNLSKASLCVVGAVSLLASALSVKAEEPVARSTPPPGTLAAYAKRVSLKRPTLRDDSGRLILTNANISELCAHGRIIVGGTAVAAMTPLEDTPTAADRARWRKAYFNQRDAIAVVERRRDLLEIEIDHIEDGRLDARRLARLENAEAKLRLLDEQIRDEKNRLAKIVREARRHGAQPDWFR